MWNILCRSVLSLLLIAYSSTIMALAEPDYQLLATIDGIEYRRYHSYLVVETIVDSETDRNEAANMGFRRLFNYISGDNAAQTSIEMTVPVQQKSAAQGWPPSKRLELRPSKR